MKKNKVCLLPLGMIKNYYLNTMLLQQDPASMLFLSAIKLIEGGNGQLHISLPLDVMKREDLPKYYCFAKGRHSGSFFLKVIINVVTVHDLM